MGKKISWIKVIDYGRAGDDLRAVYDGVRGAGGQLDNLYAALGLRPHILENADRFYRATMHDEGNSLPPWLAELIAAHVGILNGCPYVTAHHGKNFVGLFDAPEEAEAILDALRAGAEPPGLDRRARAVLRYCEKLTRRPGDMTERDVEDLRAEDFSDGEILEINQVAAGFAYWTRTINGLGVVLAGEKLGYDA